MRRLIPTANELLALIFLWALCALIAGCASFSAGPVVVSAPSLGFESPYLGATVRADVDGERMIGRAEASYLNSHKTQTKDGYGGSADLMAGAKFGRFAALVGARGNRYVTSKYSKDSWQYMAESGYRWDHGYLAGTYSLEMDGSGWWSYGLRCEAPTKHVLFVTTWEHLIFAAQNGDKAAGDRVSFGALWRF